MTAPSDLTALLARVEAATGSDRELDADLWLQLTPGATREATPVNHPKGAYVIDETRQNGRLIIVHSFTASLDASLALVERVLPGWKVSIFIGHLTGAKDGKGSRAELHSPKRYKAHDGTGMKWPKVAACYYAPTPALALLAAMLKALGLGDGTGGDPSPRKESA